MVNGVQYVIMNGILMMHKLCAKNWALAMQLLLHVMHFMDEAVDQFGLIICSVQVQSGLLETVHKEKERDIITVIILEMLV